MAEFMRTQEIEHRIGPSGRFVLRGTSADVELRAVEGDIARVRIDFEVRAGTDTEADEVLDSVRYQVRLGEGSLEVEEPKRGEPGIASITRLLGIGHVKADASVTAEIPAGAAITYSGVSADVTAIGFRGQQEYQTVSGDMVLDDLGGDVRVRGVSGDVSLRADGPLLLEMNSVSGDLAAHAPRFDQLRLVTVSGDIELEGELAGGREHHAETVSGDLSLGLTGGATLEVRGLSSDVHISLPHRAEGSRDRRRYVVGDGSAHLLFSSMSGDLWARPSRRFVGPTPPAPPVPPTPPTAPIAPRADQPVAPSPDEQLAILRALERGEIDVDEAADRLSGRMTDA